MAREASISSYHWSCSDGYISDPNSSISTITFTTAGQYWLKLTVTDSNGTTQSTYRRIYVHERTGVNAPCTDFEIIENPNGSYDNNGWSMKIRVRADADIYTIVDGTQVILWYESFYNGIEQYIGDNGNLRFVGYIKSETIGVPLSSSYVDFDVYTIDKILDSSNMFSISLEENSSVDAWYKFPQGTLTVARAIHHLWKWHSTLFEICDVRLPIANSNTMPACDDMENGTLLTLANWAYENGIFAKVCCDKIGRIFVETDGIMLETSLQNAMTEVMEILPEDMRGDVEFQYMRNSDLQCSSVVASGVAMIGGVATPLISKAPGEVPDIKGQQSYVVERLVLSSQSELNFIAGRLHAQLNRELYEVKISFSGNYPLDIAHQEWFRITFPTDVRGISYVNQQIICRSVTDVIDMKAGTCLSEGIFELRVYSTDGLEDAYPTTEDSTGPSEPYNYDNPIPTAPVTIPNTNLFGVSFSIGNGSTVIDLGEYRYTEVPFNCIIERVVLMSPDIGNVVIDIRKTTYALAPPTSADSIVGSAPPTLTNSQKYFDVTLTGWNRILNKGDILSVSVESVTGINSLLVSITGRRR